MSAAGNRQAGRIRTGSPAPAPAPQRNRTRPAHCFAAAFALFLTLFTGLTAATAQVNAADDYRLPPPPSPYQQLQALLNPIPPVAADIPASPSTISLLVLYDPLLSDANTQITTLLQKTNAIYAQSGIDLSFSLAASVAYAAKSASNSAALDEITDDAEVGNLRSLYGADMVTLLRPYDVETHGSCGVAWLIGTSGFDPFSFPGYVYDYAFSVVSIGSDSGFFCRDSSLAHELGHNFGAVHDRANTSSAPWRPYAYGWGSANVFGTVMSYLDPRVEYFSTPALATCNGYVCGDPVQADVVRAINEVRAAYAALNPDYSAPEPPGINGATPLVDSISLQFTPGDDGGVAVDSYTAYCGARTASGTASPITVVGLTPGTPYSCEVTATNAIGTSAASAAVQVDTLPIPSPTIERIDPWDEELTVYFTPATLQGSYTVSGHRVQCGSVWVDTTDTRATLGGLQNETTYACAVTTITSLGDSAPSATLIAEPEATTNGLNLILIQSAIDRQ